MPLTISARPDLVVDLVRPRYVMSVEGNLNRRRVESIASRFALRGQRRAVRVYLYGVLRDVDAIRKYTLNRPFRPRTLRQVVAKGKECLKRARVQDPALFRRLLLEFGG